MTDLKLNPFKLISTYIVGNEINKYQKKFITMYELNPPIERIARKITFSSFDILAKTLFEYKSKYNSQFIFNASKKVEDKTASKKENIEGMIETIEKTTGLSIDDLTELMTDKKSKQEFEKLMNSGKNEKRNDKIIISGSKYEPFSKKQMKELKHYLNKINEDACFEIFDVIISGQ